MHDLVIVGVPLLAIFAGILFNRSDSKELRSEMEDLRAEMKDFRSEMMSRLGVLESDMRQCYISPAS